MTRRERLWEIAFHGAWLRLRGARVWEGGDVEATAANAGQPMPDAQLYALCAAEANACVAVLDAGGAL